MNIEDNIYTILIPLGLASLVLTFAVRLGFSLYNAK